ncbi:MAG: hypothetical protein ABW189_02765 [Rickettsiales bacterium]
MKNIGILATLLCLVGCGFSPVYAVKEKGGAHREALASVDVSAPQTREGQLFARELLTLLGGSAERPIEPLYRAEVTFKEDELPLHIRRDRIVTRYRMHIDGRYVLRRIVDNAIITEGTVSSTGGYDRVDSDYSTYVSRRELRERLVKALAEECRRRLATSPVAF